MRDKTFVFGVVAVVTMAIFPSIASGQSHAGHGRAHDRDPLSASMMATAQMMHNVEMKMANVNAMMGDLTKGHADASGSDHHDRLVSAILGMLGQMQRLHGSLNDKVRDPAFDHDSESLKSFQQACRNLEQMASAFQSMTKNVTKGMKRMAHGSR